MAAAGSTSKVASGSARISWKVFTPGGPQLAYHAGCVIRGILYLHGGISKYGSQTPESRLYSFDVHGSQIWQEIREPNSPSLSHHACVALQDRYMVLIGGWNGRVRTTGVLAYDTQDQKWICPKTSGFPEGGGLSSHTASLLSNGKMLIIGRDGSARINRRFGNGYLLTGDVTGQMRYEECPIDLDSRSGHTTHIMGSNLYIVGGRTDKMIDVHPKYTCPSPNCSLASKLSAICQGATPMPKPPCGRRHHIAVVGSGVIFIHGGDTFDGRSREPVGEIFIVRTKPHIHWIKLTTDTNIGRAGHVVFVMEDKVIIHGGVGARKVVHSESHELLV